MIYLDSSALMKLVRAESETVPLGDWLGARPESSVVTSEVGRIEVFRAAKRASDAALSEAHAVIADVDLIPLDRGVQDLACEIGGALLRTLDALHLASAQLLGGELTAFVAYDRRLADAGRDIGLPVVAPGQTE